MSTEGEEEAETGRSLPDDIEYDPELFGIENLPTRGNPTQLIRIIHLLSEGGARSVDAINDSIEEFGSVYVSGNLKNGENLGFIDRTQDGVVLTDRGFELAFATAIKKVKVGDDEEEQDEDDDSTEEEEEIEYQIEDEEALHSFYREGLREYQDMKELLKAVYIESDEKLDNLIENTEILEVLRTRFGVREEQEATLKRRVTQIFYNLDAAGYGEYRSAGGGYPARLSLKTDEYLETILADILSTEAVHDGESQTGDLEESSEHEEDHVEVTAESQDEGSGEDLTEDVKEPITEDSRRISSASRTHEKYVNIDLQIDVNLEEIDTAELEAKLELISDMMD